jgi:hypothetical protein
VANRRGRFAQPVWREPISIAVRLNYRVALIEESRGRTPVERNQSGLKVDQLVAQLVVTELHSSSGFAA